MKKIFHFVKSNNLSGLENVIINICMLVKGYDYVYVSESGPINDVLKKYGIEHLIIPDLKPITILHVIKEYNPDIVQAHDPRISVLLSFSYLYCHSHNIVMISELHNTDPKMSDWWRLRSILYAIVMNMFDCVIAVSRSVLNNFVYSKFLLNNKIIINNIVNPYRIKAKLPCSLRKKWDCIFLGRIVNQKNPYKFIKIIYLLKKFKPNIRSIMIGSGRLLKNCIRLSDKYHLNNNIKFVGFKINPYKYIQQSKVLIITSRYEGFSLVALESVLVGTPVVSTNLNVLKHILGDSGFFECSNSQFAYVINRLLCNSTLYKKIKDKQFNKVSSFNNIYKFINKYKKVYG